MTTPLWVPLVVAVLGLLGTGGAAIAGVLITQRRSDEREKIAWERERDRERDRWAREDAARTFELRRENYVALYEAVDGLSTEYGTAVSMQWHPSRTSGESSEWRFSEKANVFYSALDRVMVYGSTAVVRAATGISDSLSKAQKNMTFEKVQEFERQREQLLQTVRAELGIPEGAIEAPTSSKPAN
jgi:hypothetical protein